MKKFLLCAVCALLLAACKTTPTPEAGAPVEERNPSAATGTAGTTTTGTTTTGIGGTAATGNAARNPLKDPSSPLSKRIVYFDFDSYVVKDEYKPMVEAHGRYLQANRNARMTIQGSTDERGSREYNIALGQRRADALKKLLILYGATEIQIETVSFGKEKPRREGHDESAWTENRRDEILFVGE